jgi:uncharacterized protein YdhG (YjbR/CyaY superfamily)
MAKAKTNDGFTAEEKAAMKAAATERKKAGGAAEDEADVLAAIAKMPPSDRALAERLHALVTEAAPQLKPKTWYGMPAYARDGQVVCYFQHAGKFKARYGTFGFSDKAKLDDGGMWPNAFAIHTLGDTDAARLRELVVRAAG